MTLQVLADILRANMRQVLSKRCHACLQLLGAHLVALPEVPNLLGERLDALSHDLELGSLSSRLGRRWCNTGLGTLDHRRFFFWLHGHATHRTAHRFLVNLAFAFLTRHVK